MTPSADTLILAGLLVIQQVLHHREKLQLMDRLGAKAPPPTPPARHIPQKTMAEFMKDVHKDIL